MPRLPRPITILVLAALVVASPSTLIAQSADSAKQAGAAPPPPLASFAAQKVAILPLQYFHGDSAGWGKGQVLTTMRPAFDSAFTTALLDRGMGKRWMYAGDVVRYAKRNPTLASDPFILGVSRWRSGLPKSGETLPVLIADNLRPLTALMDARYALIPVELRSDGTAVLVRLVMVDTRIRTVVFAADLKAPADAKVLETLATGFANLVLEP